MKWMGGIPKQCDVCGGDLGKVFYDASTKYGWGILCHSCFKSQGFGLGTGKGQKYDTKTLEKVAG